MPANNAGIFISVITFYISKSNEQSILNNHYWLKGVFIFNLINACVLTHTQVHATEIEMFAYSNSYSNALPLKELVEDKWKSKPSSHSDLAYSTNSLGIQYQAKHWYFSLGKRLDLIANASPDSVLALYQDKLDKPFSIEKTYQLDIELEQMEAEFVSVGYQYWAENWQLLPIVSYYQLDKMRESQLNGTVEVNQQGDFLGRVTFGEYYTEQNLLKRPYDHWRQDGKGISLTVKFNYQWGDNLYLSANGYDLLSRLEFKNTGFSSGVLDTNNTYRPELGLNSIGPLFSGVETESDTSLKLNTRYELKLDYNTPASGQLWLSAHAERFAGHQRLWLGGYKQGQQIKYQLAFDVLNAVGQIGLQVPYLKLNLALDKLDVKQAKQFKLAAAFYYQW